MSAFRQHTGKAEISRPTRHLAQDAAFLTRRGNRVCRSIGGLGCSGDFLKSAVDRQNTCRKGREPGQGRGSIKRTDDNADVNGGLSPAAQRVDNLADLAGDFVPAAILQPFHDPPDRIGNLIEDPADAQGNPFAVFCNPA